MGESQVMTHGRGTRDEELMVSEVEPATLPRASEPTTEPSEGGPGGEGGEEEEQIKWEGGPNQPPGTGTGGSGTSGS